MSICFTALNLCIPCCVVNDSYPSLNGLQDIVLYRFTTQVAMSRLELSPSRRETAWYLACEECRDCRVKAPWSRPRQHHDSQPDAVQRLGDVEQIAEPIRAINWLP